MSIEEQPVALPKLYGAPAYARPPAQVQPSPRPFDLDQLPLSMYQTDEERRIATHPPAHAYTPTADGLIDPRDHAPGGSNGLRPRLFSLRTIAGRLLGGD